MRLGECSIFLAAEACFALLGGAFELIYTVLMKCGLAGMDYFGE